MNARLLTWLFLMFLVIVHLLVPSTVIADDVPATVVDLLADGVDGGQSEFTVLMRLLEESQLVDELADPDAQLTLFAPTDEAFDAYLLEQETTLETLLSNPDALAPLLLYHIAEGVLTTADIERSMKLTTLNGKELTITVNIQRNIILDGVALLTVPDLVAGNGVVHTIDKVLVPDTRQTASADAPEPCVVRATGANETQIRVGPGNNRTSVAFLPADTTFAVTGRAEADDGSIWFQLNKDEAAPGRAINEAWVAAGQVRVAGDCEQVGVAAAPPVIPIVNQPPAPPAGGNNEQSGSAPADTSGVTLPQNGTYYLFLNPTTNTSCQGSGNLQVNSSEFYDGITVFEETIRATPEAIMLSDEALNAVGNGVYMGQIFFGSRIVVTIYLRTQTATSFYGEMIGSVVVDGVGCSFTTSYTATRQ